jgi:alcohol dehydrogenase, propanol-preferring
MKAAVVTEFGRPLEIKGLPVPEPGPGQVLVRMEASGLCHTDIHAAHGDWPVKPQPPFVPGHEGIGPVVALGPGVPESLRGIRVAIPWLGHSCGHCRYCVSGWETLCAEQRNTGYSVDGCYAEYALADAGAVVPVPDGVSSLDAARSPAPGLPPTRPSRSHASPPPSAGKRRPHPRSAWQPAVDATVVRMYPRS